MKVNWIKCSDRLPSHSMNYWVICVFDNKIMVNKKMIDVEIYDKDYKQWLTGEGLQVTHWAPIEYPEPPKETEE